MSDLEPVSDRSDRGRSGLAYWMKQVLRQKEKTRRNFSADNVHDLRVAIRRCRSLAQGMRAVDLHPGWRRLNKLARDLFTPLGAMRDTQILLEWIAKLSPLDDAVGSKLIETLERKEKELEDGLTTVLDLFDEERWSALSIQMPTRIKSLPPDGLVFSSLALQRYDEALTLHKYAMKNRNHTAFHRLRIGIKRFRYTVENYMPRRHALWKDELKLIQDLLGEMHDLDVLWDLLRQPENRFTAADRQRWRKIIQLQWQERLTHYRSLALGSESCWIRWRRELPQGIQLEQAGIERIRATARSLDSDFARTQQVSRLALELWKGLAKILPHEEFAAPKYKRVLTVAAAFHRVNPKKRKTPNFQKNADLLRQLPPFPGWSDEEIDLAGWAISSLGKQYLSEAFDLLPDEDPHIVRNIWFVAGILRMACVLALDSTQPPHTIKISMGNEVIYMQLVDWSIEELVAARLAGEKFILETALQRPLAILPYLSLI